MKNAYCGIPMVDIEATSMQPLLAGANLLVCASSRPLLVNGGDSVELMWYVCVSSGGLKRRLRCSLEL